MSTPIEIERKYVIALPDISEMSKFEDYSVSKITQDYLTSSPHVTHRVRKREYKDFAVYTETKKIRVDKMSSLEDEINITEEEYRELLKLKSPAHKTVNKIRHTFKYLNHLIEIDVYPEWKRSCILETELESREEEAAMPPFIKIIREVTGEKAYSNAGMARSFPEELI